MYASSALAGGSSFAVAAFPTVARDAASNTPMPATRRTPAFRIIHSPYELCPAGRSRVSGERVPLPTDTGAIGGTAGRYRENAGGCEKTGSGTGRLPQGDDRPADVACSSRNRVGASGLPKRWTSLHSPVSRPREPTG